MTPSAICSRMWWRISRRSRWKKSRQTACGSAAAAARSEPTGKVSVGYVDGFIGEGQISYAGPGALARGRLAIDIVRERLKLTGVATRELRFELIGVDSLHGAEAST